MNNGKKLLVTAISVAFLSGCTTFERPDRTGGYLPPKNLFGNGGQLNRYQQAQAQTQYRTPNRLSSRASYESASDDRITQLIISLSKKDDQLERQERQITELTNQVKLLLESSKENSKGMTAFLSASHKSASNAFRLPVKGSGSYKKVKTAPETFIPKKAEVKPKEKIIAKVDTPKKKVSAKKAVVKKVKTTTAAVKNPGSVKNPAKFNIPEKRNSNFKLASTKPISNGTRHFLKEGVKAKKKTETRTVRSKRPIKIIAKYDSRKQRNHYYAKYKAAGFKKMHLAYSRKSGDWIIYLGRFASFENAHKVYEKAGLISDLGEIQIVTKSRAFAI